MYRQYKKPGVDPEDGGGGGPNLIGQNCEQRVVTVRGYRQKHCAICLEFRLAAKYNGSPYVNQLSNNKRSCRCENFSVKQKKNSVREGGPYPPPQPSPWIRHWKVVLVRYSICGVSPEFWSKSEFLFILKIGNFNYLTLR